MYSPVKPAYSAAAIIRCVPPTAMLFTSAASTCVECLLNRGPGGGLVERRVGRRHHRCALPCLFPSREMAPDIHPADRDVEAEERRLLNVHCDRHLGQSRSAVVRALRGHDDKHVVVLAVPQPPTFGMPCCSRSAAPPPEDACVASPTVARAFCSVKNSRARAAVFAGSSPGLRRRPC